MNVDPKVYALASCFLAEVKDATDDDKQELAQEIQITIEAYLDFHRAVLAVSEHPSPL